METSSGERLSCQQCGVAFVRPDIRGPRPKWCSPACANRAYRRRKKPENFGPLNCPVCGSVFEREKASKRVCSAVCRYKFYYRNNKAACDAQTDAWHRAHSNKVAGYVAASRAKKPEHYRLMRRVNEAARRARMRGTFTPAEWNYLRGLYGGHCLCCGRHESLVPLHADHVIPVSKGGRNVIWNIQPLCQPCNSAKFQRATDFRLDHLVGLG